MYSPIAQLSGFIDFVGVPGYIPPGCHCPKSDGAANYQGGSACADLNHDETARKTGLITIQKHHPFTLPIVSPDWKKRWAYRNRMIKGTETTTEAAAK